MRKQSTEGSPAQYPEARKLILLRIGSHDAAGLDCKLIIIYKH
jgi:hypothetical protein